MRISNLISASILALAIGLAPSTAFAKDHYRAEHRRIQKERLEHRRQWVRAHRDHRRDNWRRQRDERAAMHRWDRDHHQRYAHSYDQRPNGWEQGRKTGWNSHNSPPRGDYRHGQPVAQHQNGPVVWHPADRR